MTLQLLCDLSEHVTYRESSLQIDFVNYGSD